LIQQLSAINLLQTEDNKTSKVAVDI